MEENKLKKNEVVSLKNIVMFIPILFFILCIIFLVIEKRASLKNFWVGGFFSLCLAYILIKDKKKFGEKCIESMKNNTLLTCIVIFILAGILSSILQASGISGAFLTLFIKIGIDVRLLPLIIFIICCVISTCIGTSTGTISMAVPIFLPVVVAINCNPALILGAIVCGSFFGDNLSPISDTTIISINAMKVDLYDTLKERLKISLICMFLSCIVYAILGYALIPNTEINLTYNNSLKPLILMTTFILMIILLAKKNDMISVLLICDFFAIILSMLCGFMNVGDLFGDNSCIITGIESIFGVIVFWIFLFILTGFMPDGILEKLIEKKVNSTHGIIKTNLTGVLVIISSILMVSNNTAAMSLISNFIDKCFKGKSQVQKANIYDGLSCAVPALLPYNTAFMLMVSLAYETSCMPKNFSILSILSFSVNSIFLLIVYIAMAMFHSKRKNVIKHNKNNIDKKETTNVI